MYLQGGAIWHPRCGPGPTDGGSVVGVGGTSSLYNGTNGNYTDAEIDRISNSAMSEMQVSEILDFDTSNFIIFFFVESELKESFKILFRMFP